VWVGVLPTSPQNVRLTSAFRLANDLPTIDAYGAALKTSLPVVPHGALLFFPSYKSLETLVGRWTATGALADIERIKEIFRGKSLTCVSLMRPRAEVWGLKRGNNRFLRSGGAKCRWEGEGCSIFSRLSRKG
jgi:hypothetical protein